MPTRVQFAERNLTCPDRKMLSELALGRIASVEIDRLESHVETCSTCQRVLETFDDLEDSVIADLKRQVEVGKPDSKLEEQIRLAEVISREVWSETIPETADTPKFLGQYELLQKLGEGGMGTVWKALHLRLKRHVAIKLLREARLRDFDARARFQREMEAVGRLDHMHLVRAHDAGELEGRHFLAMEFLDGTDLSKVVRSHGPLQIADACEVVRQAAIGLQHAHENGLVHRDVKPSNLMLTQNGTVKVLDLGLARLLDAGRPTGDLTDEGKIVGSGNFIAPEQIVDTRTADARADVYSLGCTLYFLLAGKAPFSGPEFDTIGKKLLAHSHRPFPSIRKQRSGVPEALSNLLIRMVAKDPTKRIQTAQSVVEAIGQFCTGNNLKRLATGELGNRSHFPEVQPISSRRHGRLWLILPGTAFLALIAWNSQMLLMVVRGEGQLTVTGDQGKIVLTRKKTAELITLEPAQRDGFRVGAGEYDVRFADDPISAIPQPSRIIISTGQRTVVKLRRDSSALLSLNSSSDFKKTEAPVDPLRPKEIVNSIGTRLRLIPAGEFVMGSPGTEQGRDPSEGPQHNVRITRPFYIGAFEVTQAEYELVTGRNPSRFQDAVEIAPTLHDASTKKLPVESVRWPDAVEFCEKLSLMDAERKAGHDYRLPTEAEWEYACRAKSATVFHFGDTLSPGQANFNTKFPYGAAAPSTKIGCPKAVCSFQPNAWGLYDMHGNVWEWCHDWFDEDHYHHALKNDPQGPKTGMHHVLRGGGWGVRGDWCRSARRTTGEMVPQLFYSIGFRVVCEVKREIVDTK
jgi:formylglycine-generating enzyme required for sulfatase activity/serine/threonine protein kinase